ncbi:WD40/YVTN/BNR-like repeat-containing protein [Natrialba taiwanensis]|uniref:BNR repeat-containing glycosyl hydrolase n=1 Tax=Natrialba taiwanensis DSM 12281 TaxID=1230458 RepID=L9ZI42_9EURY|nr:glycosyl hydrolase [Natrialba taiwanensis]ELY86165.1 BNR repeat-containing glycosyl hydrolase [Natrialba taiwanensis DSM 12281]
MVVLIGTRDGVYRSATVPVGNTDQVLDSGNTPRIRTFPAVDGVFAATKSGLYRSVDEGKTWENLDVPREEVYSVVASPDGERLYAGTHPAHLYVSTDGGDTWDELEGFQDLPSRDQWHTPRHRNEAHVRSLGVHPETPDRIIVGVEVGGVHISDDQGETWTERRDGVHDDVHHVLIFGPDEYVASTGDGLYRTQDAGQSWTRLDTRLDNRYFREAFAFDGRLYAAAARSSPGAWRGENGADATLVESSDSGKTLEAVSYPGKPEEVILAWTVINGHVLAGTNDGRLINRDADGSWVDAGLVSGSIRSLATRE